jgi:hypothetical protein
MTRTGIQDPIRVATALCYFFTRNYNVCNLVAVLQG